MDAVRKLLGDSLAYLYPAALRVAVRTRIADHLADGPLPPGRLAALAGAEPDHLRRVLRFLATRDVFREDENGAFHLTTAASLLRSDSPLPVRSLVLLFTDPLYWLPAGCLEDTVRAGRTAFDDVFGAPIFDHLATDKAGAELFSDAMAALSEIEQDGIAAACDLPQRATIVDIGGGLGGMLRTILTRNPGLRGVLYDREPVLHHHRLDDPAIAGRWETAAGDFYDQVPPGADVYLLKRILHDKTDTDCLRVLRAVRHAMPDGSRLLIVDPLVPAGGDIPPATMLSDLLVMAVFGGRERTRDELAALLSEADLLLHEVIPTTGTLTITEAHPTTRAQGPRPEGAPAARGR
ncbi:methyltransferase [Actinomadura sp. 9N407]|uniref:methyltransferase n=1 Tax=Actinomadura sp. 9N407 TaxID=3375154 RepID=UPI00379883B4